MVEPDLWGERARPWPRQLGLDVAWAALFALVAGVLGSAQDQGPVLVATVAMGAALAVRRLARPVMVLLAAATGMLQVVAGELALFADVGYAPIFFVLGAHPRAGVRRFGLIGAVASAVVLAAAVGTGRIGEASTGGSTAYAIVASAALALLVSAGGWAAGYARWQSRVRINAQVQTELETERARIAADMHDLVAHTWAVVAAQADGARYALTGPDGEQKARDALDVIADTARISISDLRDLLAELRYQEPPTPMQPTAREALVARVQASGMELSMIELGTPPATGSLVVAAHRLLSESLTNALKHGHLGYPVAVEEDWREGYRLVVSNRLPDSPTPARTTGQMMDPPVVPAVGAGHGLAGMRERVNRAGGRFQAGPSGATWTLVAVLPAATR